MLDPFVTKTIGDFFAARPRFTPISPVLTSPQETADKNNIYVLGRLSDDNYYLQPKKMNTLTIPALNGRFIFVIKDKYPGLVYCAKAFDPLNQYLSDNNRGVAGHTSLTKRKNILFAGDLIFANKKLICWSNASGHYQPASELRHRNLLPHIKLLLPEALFTPIDFDRASVASVVSTGSRFAALSSGDFSNRSDLSQQFSNSR